MHWQPYTPDDKAPWNLRRVVHLHRRAGFLPSWEVLERDVRDGPKAAADRLLDGKVSAAAAPADFESLAATIGDAAVASGSVFRLKAWWLYRMLFSPDSLGEKLTLVWHNHFATSYRKVQDLAMMRRQNDVFRQFARGPFAELLTHAIKDPAMLLWLDADSNRREHPNENLGRELMELFTLGVGNYGEDDVKEAARALTGWTVKNREFREVPAYHDDGEKTVLGRRGKLRGDDLLMLLVEQPATSVRLARRICELLMGEGMVDAAAIEELAAGLREQDNKHGSNAERAGTTLVAGAELAGSGSSTSSDDAGQRCPGDGATGASPRQSQAAKSDDHRGSAPATATAESGIRWAIETVLRSAAFFAEENIGNRVLDPVEYIVGAVRALEVFNPPPSTIVLAEWAAAMGQDLFEPPNVFGWAGGRAWLNTRSIVARSNFAQRLAEGALQSGPAAPDWPALAERRGCGGNAAELADFLAKILWAGGTEEDVRQARQAAIGGETALSAETARRLVAGLLGSPQAQLG